MPKIERGVISSDHKHVLHVLVVDDNREAADSLAALVKLWGHEARAAYGGAAALEMASTFQPDVVLSDLSMPGMDGCQVARQLRRQARFRQSLLIAVTGWADQARLRLCEEAGFDHYLVKPIGVESLRGLLLQERVRPARPAGAVAGGNGIGWPSLPEARSASFSEALGVLSP